MLTGQPKGLYLLFFTEMAERFSYYGMRALFVLYLVAAFYTPDNASRIYGTYTGLVYLTPLLGGYIADRYWGNRRSIIVGAIFMAVGQFLMFASACVVRQSIFSPHGAIDPTVDNSLSLLLMFTGLAALIFGNGFFKANISTMVGDLYSPTDKRRDGAFTIFYMGINMGALLAPLICGYVGTGDWSQPSLFRWGFFSAGCGMLVSLIIFVSLKNRLLVSPDGKSIGMKPVRPSLTTADAAAANASAATTTAATAHNSPLRTILCLLLFVVLMLLFTTDPTDFNALVSAMIYSCSIALPLFIITDRALTAIEKRRIGVIYIIAVFVIFFWSAFEQAGSSLTLFAETQVDRRLTLPAIGPWEVPTTWFQSINPIVVVTFAPIMATLWDILSRHHLEPSSPAKQALGLALLALGYCIIAFATHGVSTSTKISLWWLVALYFIHTIGELSLSPIGLSMVTRLSPSHLASLLMGVWFMSNAASNIFAGQLATLLPAQGKAPASLFGIIEISTLSHFFILFAVMAGIAALLLLLLTPMIRRMSGGVI